VEQIDMASNQVIRVWESVNTASRFLNIAMNDIYLAAIDKIDTAGGFKWKFLTSLSNTADDDLVSVIAIFFNYFCEF
jgi:hypothetical protein